MKIAAHYAQYLSEKVRSSRFGGPSTELLAFERTGQVSPELLVEVDLRLLDPDISGMEIARLNKLRAFVATELES